VLLRVRVGVGAQSIKTVFTISILKNAIAVKFDLR
jgi:hypothetical protein